MRGYRAAGVVAVLAAGTGLLVGLLTSHGPAGDSWSLRGDGAAGVVIAQLLLPAGA